MIKKHVVLALDDDKQVLYFIRSILESESIDVICAESLEEAFKIIKNLTIHILITDYYLPDGESISLIEKIKEDDPSLPIIVLTGGDENTLKIPTIEKGANFLLTKPIQGRELKGIVYNFLSLFDAYENLENAQAIIDAFSKTIDARDTYTEGHSQRVADYSLQLYDAIGYDNYKERQNLYIGCLLHDIGKIGVTDNILKSKKFPLSEKQIKEIKLHPNIGYEICKDIKRLGDCLDIIKHHHEKLDGSGYPDKLKDEEISVLVQIATIADIYDALTSKRSYRDEKTPVEAFEIMEMEGPEKINNYFLQLLKKIILQ